jgi:transcriptional regulator with GAF, ATPase, and Fis domain
MPVFADLILPFIFDFGIAIEETVGMAQIDVLRILEDLTRFDTAISHFQAGSVAEAALRFVQQHLQPSHASIVVCDPDRTDRQLVTLPGNQTISFEPLDSEDQTDLIERAMTASETVYCRDVVSEVHREDVFVRRLPADIRSIAILPLKTRTAVIGTLNIGSPRIDGLPSDHQAFLEAAAARLAAALGSAQWLEKLESDCSRLQKECDLQKSALKKNHDVLELEVVRRTAEIQKLQERLQAENTYLKEELAGAHPYGEIIGESPSMRSIVARIDLVAPTGASVLILGESGTGKELIAREIHRHCQRADRPLIKVNCATIPRELYESEFFGHIKGSFTGAISDRLGRFEAADGGTLFLDEVGEIPPGLQGKLLRVLQEGEFERVGEGRTRKVDVRIIAATNINLAEEVKNRRFREDLYYRLNVFPIEIPPLRDHREDIPLLAAHFIKVFSHRLNRPVPRLSKANLLDLKAHDWPGNVRELQNIIERALILSPLGRLRFDLPRINGDLIPPFRNLPEDPAAPAESILTESEIRALQKRNTLGALVHANWKVYGSKGAAQLLGIKPTTLIERMRRLRIKRPE